jgi:adenylylsulfate kinase
MMDVHRTTKRSLVKATTYRAVIIVLDFSVIYVLTRRVDVALGFMVISNIYTTVAYFVHERIWNKIRWGIESTKQSPA